jgi:predicted permease
MTWWQRLWRRRQLEEQLEKELRFHLDQHTMDLIAQGHDPAEARRQARIAIGGPEQVKESCRDARGTRWLEDLRQDATYALRTLRKNSGFAAVALLTLALGIGATTVMFTVINGVLLKPLSYPEPERLVTLHEQTEKYGGEWSFAYLNFLDCKRESRSLAPMAAWRHGGGTVSEPGEAEYVSGRQISADLFSVLGIDLLRGRAFLPEEDRPGAAPVAIISYRSWQRLYGGNPDAIGQRLVFSGKTYTVVGIAPAGFRLSGEADVFTPLGQNTEPITQNRDMHPGIRVVARLRPGLTLAQAQAELALIGRHLAEQYPKSNAGHGIVAQPLQQEVVGGVRPTLWLLLGAVSLVLVIACVNVASLLLARALSRERELAMRVALGADRGRLVRQCLTESAVLALSGGLLGVMLAAVGTRPFLLFWPGSLPRAEEVHLDWRALLFAVTASLLSGLLFGLAPALRAPVRELEQALRAGARTLAGSSRRLHSSFVASEIALAVVLLVAAGILGRTLLRLSYVDPGINVRNVLVTQVALSANAFTNPARTRAAWQDMLDRVRTVPGVESVAVADIIPLEGDDEQVGYWTGSAAPPANQMPLTLVNLVTPRYLQVMGIPLRQGRFFNEQDRIGNQPVVVIDEVMAQRAFHGRDSIGNRLWLQFLGPALVVGVVGHVRHWGLDADDQAKIREQIYLPFAQLPDAFLRLASSMSLVVRTIPAPLAEVEAVRREARGAARDQALYGVRTMEQIVSGTLARQRFLLLLFGIFAGLALLLACIGIYGVLAYLTSQRVPEIGMRMALGANSGAVIWLVLRQSVGMILAGVGLGIAAAWAAGRVLGGLVEGMQPPEPSTFAIMIPILVVAALFASLVPARRASRIDPVRALRQE